jgi:hypothetical protein
MTIEDPVRKVILPKLEAINSGITFQEHYYYMNFSAPRKELREQQAMRRKLVRKEGD